MFTRGLRSISIQAPAAQSKPNLQPTSCRCVCNSCPRGKQAHSPHGSCGHRSSRSICGSLTGGPSRSSPARSGKSIHGLQQRASSCVKFRVDATPKVVSNGAAQRKHLFIILHGKKAGDAALRAAIGQLREDGHSVSIRVTYEGDCMPRFVSEALRVQADVIVAAGGDGSINQAVAALVEADAPRETALAIIPMGTANDFARGLGIPEDPWEALEVALHRPAQDLDVGTVNGRIFINVATGGFGTELTVKTDEEMKKNLGGAAYAITGLTNFGTISSKAARLTGSPQQTMRKGDNSYTIAQEEGTQGGLGQLTSSQDQVAVEGGQQVDVEGNLLVLAVGNGRQAGGGVRLCPNAVLNDGLLDVSYVMNLPAERIPEVLGSIGQPSDQHSAQIQDCWGSLRVPSLEVSCKEGLQVNVDGEPVYDTNFKFEVLPKRLRLHVPEPRLLTSSSQPEREKGTEKFKEELDHTETRPEQKSTPIWRKPIFRAVVQNAVVLAVGMGLGIFFGGKPIRIKA